MTPLLGTQIPKLFPLFLIFLCFLTIFDFYGKFLNWLGLKQFKFSTAFSDEGVEEG